MSQVIAVAGQKGGSGKSTSAVGLAAEFMRRGKTVLLVDADRQGTARTWGDVASEQGLVTPTIVSLGANLAQPQHLPQLSQAYDITVVDTPGRDGAVQREALLVADLAILPCGPSAADAWAMAESVEVVKKAMEPNPNLIARILITRKVPRTVIGTSARAALEGLGVPIFATELGFRVAYQEFLASGAGLVEYASSSRDAAAQEFTALVEEVDTILAQQAAVAEVA